MARCKPAPKDQAGPVRRIEVSFAIPVNITRQQERRLHELLDDIVSQPSNQIVDGVHWVSAYGGKVLWNEPEEPDIDMDILAIETTARPFVSDKERERLQRVTTPLRWMAQWRCSENPECVDTKNKLLTHYCKPCYARAVLEGRFDEEPQSLDQHRKETRALLREGKALRDEVLSEFDGVTKAGTKPNTPGK